MSKFYELISIACEARNSYASDNCIPEEKSTTGHLLELTVNGIGLQADTIAWDPVNSKKDNVVAIIDEIEWVGSPTEPIGFCIRISPKNRAMLREALVSSDEKPVFELKWVVYEYDYDAKQFYRVFYTDKEPIILTPDGRIRIQNNPDIGTAFPVSYLVSFTLIPNDGGREQDVFFAFSATGKKFSRKMTSGSCKTFLV
jgi:hypothetical protein